MEREERREGRKGRDEGMGGRVEGRVGSKRRRKGRGEGGREGRRWETPTPSSPFITIQRHITIKQLLTREDN